MNHALRWVRQGLNTLDQLGLWVGLLSLRWLLAWEFGEAGVAKLHGSNWFAGHAFLLGFIDRAHHGGHAQRALARVLVQPGRAAQGLCAD